MCIGSIQIFPCSLHHIFQVLDVYREHSDLSLLTLSNCSGVDVYREHSDLSLPILSYLSGVGCV